MIKRLLLYILPGTVKQLRESWSSSKELHLDNDKIGLFSEPFPCCSLKQFLETKNQEDLGNLIQELDDLDYAQKNNDLYKFRQSGDLKNVHSSLLRQFRYVSNFGLTVGLVCSEILSFLPSFMCL